MIVPPRKELEYDIAPSLSNDYLSSVSTQVAT